MNKLNELPINTKFGKISYSIFRKKFSQEGYRKKICSDYTWNLKLNNTILKSITLCYAENECEINKCELCEYLKNNNNELEKIEEIIIPSDRNIRFRNYGVEFDTRYYLCALVPEFDKGNLKAIVQEHVANCDSEYWFQVGFIDIKNNIVYYNSLQTMIFDAIEENAKIVNSKICVKYSECYSINSGKIIEITLEEKFKELYDSIIKHNMDL